jgi:hypothetical protein
MVGYNEGYYCKNDGDLHNFTVPFEYGELCREFKDTDERDQTGASLVVEIDQLIRERDHETDKA